MASKTAGEVKPGDKLVTLLGLIEVVGVEAGDKPGQVKLVAAGGGYIKVSQHAYVEVFDNYQQLRFSFKLE